MNGKNTVSITFEAAHAQQDAVPVAWSYEQFVEFGDSRFFKPHWECVVSKFRPEGDDTKYRNVRALVYAAALSDATGKADAAIAGGLTKLLDALANCGGTIVSTAALDTVQIAAARMENRMYVREDGCGFVHMPRRASAFNAEPYNKFMREWSEGWMKDADKHSGSQPATSAADAKGKADDIFARVLDALHKHLSYPTEACTIVRAVQQNRPIPEATGKADAASADGLRAALREFVDYHTKPAGMTVEIATDTDALGAFMEGVEVREKAMVARAQALLYSTDNPPTEKVGRSPIYQAQFDGERGSSVWHDVTEAAYHTFMPEHRRIVYAAPVAKGGERECQYPHESAECKGCGWKDGAKGGDAVGGEHG